MTSSKELSQFQFIEQISYHSTHNGCCDFLLQTCQQIVFLDLPPLQPVPQAAFPIYRKAWAKNHAPFLRLYNHYTLACKYRINADNSTLSVDETFKSWYNKSIKFVCRISFGFFWNGRICYDRYVYSLLDYPYKLGYNGINRVEKLLDMSEFEEVIYGLYN